MPLSPAGKETGWLSKYAFQVDALAADAVGRAAIADAFFAATAAMRAKFADGFINAAKIADGVITAAKFDTATRANIAGWYDLSEYGRSVYH